MLNTVVTATGSYIPAVRVPNDHFLDHEFYGADGRKLERPNPLIIKKLYEISGISERRYVTDDLVTSDIACQAAEAALVQTDREGLDYIIVAQNLGDVKAGNLRTDMVPTHRRTGQAQAGDKKPLHRLHGPSFWLPGMAAGDDIGRHLDQIRQCPAGAGHRGRDPLAPVRPPRCRQHDIRRRGRCHPGGGRRR